MEIDGTNERAEKRKSNFFYHPLNTKLRELLTDEKYLSMRASLEIESTADFARKIGVTAEAVRQWTSGYSRPSVDTLASIHEQFGISSDWLLGLSEFSNQNEIELLLERVHELDSLSLKQKSLLLWSLGYASERLKNINDRGLQWEIVNMLVALIENFGKMIYLPEELQLDVLLLATLTQHHRDALDCINRLDKLTFEKIYLQHFGKGGDINGEHPQD